MSFRQCHEKNMRLWIEALRSGEYQQGTGRLNDMSGKFCCLGVACEIAAHNGVELRVKADARGMQYEDSALFLPAQVEEWLGLSYLSGATPDVLMPEGGMQSVVYLNDEAGKDFAYIADRLESTFLQPAELPA